MISATCAVRRARCRPGRAPRPTRPRAICEDRGADRLGQVVADREARSGASRQQSSSSCVAPARVGAHQRSRSSRSCSAGICASACSSDRDLIGGGVGAGVAGPQHAGQRLAGLVAVGQQRVKAEAALEVAGRALLLGMRWRSASRRGRSSAARARRPASRRARAPGRARARSASSSARVARDPVDHPKRRRVRRDRPEQRRPDHAPRRDRPGSRRRRRASPPDRGPRGPDHGRRARSTQPASRSDSARVSPILSADLRQQRAARMRHQPVSVRRDFYRDMAPIALHLQGDPPEPVLRPSATRRIPAQADSSSGPDHRGRYC